MYNFRPNRTKIGTHVPCTCPGGIRFFSDFCDFFPARDGRPKLVGGAYFTKHAANREPNVRSTPNLNHTRRRTASTPNQRNSGNHTMQLLRSCTFSSYYYLRSNPKFRFVSPRATTLAATWAICQIDRLHRESCATILLRERLYRLIDMNLLVN